MMKRGLIVIIMILIVSPKVYAIRMVPPPREVVLTVQSCRLIDPYQEKKLMEFAERYPKSFVESTREQFVKEAQEIVETYRGAVIEGTNPEGSSGKYLYQSKDSGICEKFKSGAQIKVIISYADCDGDPNPPCYIGFSGLMKDAKSEKELICSEDNDCIGVHDYVPPREEGYPAKTLISCKHKDAPLKEGEWIANENWNAKCTCNREEQRCYRITEVD